MAERRLARLRREYIYRRSLKGKQAELYEKQRILKKCLQEGKPIPGNLKAEIVKLKESLDTQDAASEAKGVSDLDNEYANSGVEDPKVMVTTSYVPSQKLLQFAKELSDVIPDATRMNRGQHSIRQLTESCRNHNVTDLIIIHESKGIPDGMIVSHMPLGPTAYFGLVNVVTRHEIEDAVPMSLQKPHLIFHGFSTKLGERVTNILKFLFPACKDDSKRVVTFANENDFISFRHHTFKKNGNQVELTEIGPRFEMKLYQLRLGTIEMKEAENEWVLRPYMNTAYKRKAL
eukprot:TRINITY_DN169_c0_g1_i1.p1 TRINITY_DN169_c0_g1~~TRINITY_DN169_c0_g1_i1.p1  ORF type:complete len:289 (-),score=43.83 TRINITY_DN169_c0_g1_i1:180-1046(-)